MKNVKQRTLNEKEQRKMKHVKRKTYNLKRETKNEKLKTKKVNSLLWKDMAIKQLGG